MTNDLTSLSDTTLSASALPASALPDGERPGPAAATLARPGDLNLLISQIRFEQRAFWRNRSRAFFSVGFPLVFLVVFNAINGNHHISELGGISYATWFVPGILAYGLIMATFTNIAVSTTIARDSGILKRIRGTALPPWIFLAGRIGSTLITAAVLVGVTLALGVGAYGVTIPTATLPAIVATLVLGTVCFTSLGLAITCAIPNADAAPAIVNLIVLPLTFISGIWMVLSAAPGWLDTTAGIFPVRALAHGLQHAFDPSTTGVGIEWGGLGVLALWAVGGLVVSLRWFRWEPRR